MGHNPCQFLLMLVVCSFLPHSHFLPGLGPPLLLAVSAQSCPQTTGPRGQESPPDPSRPKDHGALNPLLSSAESTRLAILSELPYGRIRDEIRKQ